MKTIKVITFIFMTSLMFSCNQESKENEGLHVTGDIFPKGELGSEEYFTGRVWHYGLVPNDTTFQMLSGNVYFEAGARSNWHLHPGGQILIVTSGIGYHQLMGQPIEVIKKGDVVKCPPNKLHWHGASKDNSMSHIYIIPNTEKGIVEWKQPVTDEEYSSL